MPLVRSLPCLVVALALLFPVAASAETARLGAADRAAIEEIVRDYIRTNPEIVLEALHTLEERHQAEAQAEQRAAIEARRAAIYDDPDDYTYGNPKGDVTIVEFFDYTCGTANAASSR